MSLELGEWVSVSNDGKEQLLLERFMKLSILASVLTIALKVYAAVLTGSVGFLSDAMESGVNLVAAVVGFLALKISAKPADHNHHFGHGKAEYVSALVEGAMIFVASALIIYSAAHRLVSPQELEQPGLGLLLSTVASVINLLVGLVLVRAGSRYRSATLTADGKHLLTDVWTSVGVLVGIGLVWLTGWLWVDPVVALLVGVNILWTGYVLLRTSLSGLLSEAIPEAEREVVEECLQDFVAGNEVEITSVRTVAAGRQRFVYLTMEVPEEWTVGYSHTKTEEVESAVGEVLAGSEVFVHVEPK